MAGNVYCFNAYNEPMNQLNVNGFVFGTATPAIGGWTSSGATIYTPAAVAVPRLKHGDGTTAGFPNDQATPLRFNWDTYTVQTSIDLRNLPNVSLDDDLILYIAVNQMTLMQTRGFVLKTVPYAPQSQAPQAEEVPAAIHEPSADY